MLLIRLVLGVLVWCLTIVGVWIAPGDGVDSLGSALIFFLLTVLLVLLGQKISELWAEWKKSRRVPASADMA